MGLFEVHSSGMPLNGAECETTAGVHELASLFNKLERLIEDAPLEEFNLQVVEQTPTPVIVPSLIDEGVAEVPFEDFDTTMVRWLS